MAEMSCIIKDFERQPRNLKHTRRRAWRWEPWYRRWKPFHDAKLI